MRYWFYAFVKAVLWVFFRIGFGLEVSGQEHVPQQGSFIVASNHVSYLDPPVIGVSCPRRLSFLARSTLFRHPLLGAFLRGIHAIPLKREEGDLGAVRTAVLRLQRGEPVAIFPEGGRQLSGRLGTAKRGVGLLAEAARGPVIPAVVTGTFAALPPTSTSFHLHRAKIRVAFGPPIPYTTDLASTAGPSGRSVRSRHQQLADVLTQQWRRMLEQIEG